MSSLKIYFAKASRIALAATTLMMCLSVASTTTAQSTTIVKTNSGKISGVASSDGMLISFKGVPYAAPPVGDLRCFTLDV